MKQLTDAGRMLLYFFFPLSLLGTYDALSKREWLELTPACVACFVACAVITCVAGSICLILGRSGRR